VLIKLARGLVLLVLFLLASCATSAPRGAAAPVSTVQFRMRDFHLRSGLRIVVEEDHSAPILGVVNVVGVGSTSDPPGKEGLAHLVEHLTFRAKPAPGRTMWSLFDQAGGADVNAFTGWDATVYRELGPRDLLVDLLTLEGLRIVDPLAGLDEATFATERDVVRNALRQRGETAVVGSALAAIQKATFPPGHPYARPVIGTHESLSAITLDDARAFVKKHYRPSNMTILVIGDVDLAAFDKVLAASISPALNAPTSDPIVRGPRLAPQAPDAPAPPPSTGVTTIEGNVAAPELYLAWSLPRGYDVESYLGALALAGTRDAIGDAAALDADIVSGTVLVAPGMQSSLLIAHVVLRTGDHPDASARRVVDQLYRSWAGSDGESAQVADNRFAHRRAKLASRTLLDAEDILERGVERAEFVHFAGDPTLYARKIDALGRVDRAKLAEFHRRYVNRERVRTIVVRPVPPGQRAPDARTGIADAPQTAGSAVVYDVASIPKIAIPAGIESAFRREPLDNGMTIEAARHGTMPMVTVGMSFRGGTTEEAPPGAIALAQDAAAVGHPIHGRFEDHGALFWRWTTADAYEFRVHVPAQQLGPVLDILADHVASLRVHSEALRDFDRSVLPYLRRAQALPENVAARAFGRALFRGHRYGNSDEVPAEGRPGADEANAWLAAVLSPQNATLTIAGDVEPADAVRLARSAFGGWSGEGPLDAPPPRGEAGTHAAIVAHRPGATQAEVRIGCRLPAAGPAETVRNDVLAAVLGARLNTAIREQLGVSYGFGAYAQTLRGGTATLYASGTVENAGLARALRIVRDELAMAERWTDADLARGRWVSARSYNLGLATADDWVRAALTAERRGWGLGSIDGVPRALAAIDRAKVVAPLVRCASEGVVSIVGDEATAKRALAEVWP
jgi:zinc protease